ncbi:M56 family metallopeptidase [Psychroserpens sp.]|uniref:M56 family metallopeptidase n=1 Tax=Psychroserpens sp. TaxID=2020870 RepID=UPI00385AEFFA
MEYLLKSSAVILLFYLCFYLFLKKETFFQHNRGFLLTGIIIALVFPLIVIPVYIPIETTPIVLPKIEQINSNMLQVVEQSSVSKFEWSSLLPIIYTIGLLLFFIQFIFQFGSLALLVLKNPKNKDGLYTYVTVNYNISPFSFFKWIVYNPENYQNEELELILTHEKVHASQLHSIDILITQLACVIFWFNPLIWLYRKAIRQNLEYIADFKTQSASNKDRTYQHLLLKTSITNHQIPLSNNFYNSLIKERIIMLKKSRSNKRKQWRYLFILPMLAVLLMSVNTKEIFIEKEVVSETSKNILGLFNGNDSEVIEIIITKNTSDDDLQNIEKELKSKGITFDYSGVKRNSDGEIISISTEFKNSENSSNYNISGKEGIKSFRFNSSNDSFGVGTIDKKTFVFTSEGKNVKAQSTNSADKIIIIEENDSNNGSGTNVKVWKSKDTIYTTKNNNRFTFSSDDDDNEEPIFIIDGKKVKKSIFENVDSDDIESVFILKDNNATKKYGEDGKNGVIVMTKKGSKNSSSEDHVIIKSSNNFTIKTDGDDPLVILNGKIVGQNDMKDINPDDILSVDVLKDKSVTKRYGKEGENGVIIIRTKKNNSVKSELLKKGNYLYIMDGKEISKSDLEKIYSKETVSSLTVLDKKEAIEKYGQKGKNGVVIVTSKNNKNYNTETLIDSDVIIYESEQKGPWKIESAVSSVYVIDDDGDINAIEFVITKSSSDAFLDKQKKDLKAQGIDGKRSKGKRNKAGEITCIKITLDDNNGRKSSASWKEKSEAIPDIVMGKSRDDKLFVRAIGN